MSGADPGGPDPGGADPGGAGPGDAGPGGLRRAAVLVLAGPPAAGACPPGVAPAAFARALAEDIADLLVELPGLEPVVAAAADRVADAEEVVWPGTLVLETVLGTPAEVFGGLAARGYHQAALVAADAPDLPGLLVAKPFSRLTSASVAAVPADGGGLVVLAARLPAPAWLPAGLTLDTADAVERLRAGAPSRRDFAVAPGWRRLRTPADLARLDPGLEGWETTRALLGG
jgi:hypothetical protein